MPNGDLQATIERIDQGVKKVRETQNDQGKLLVRLDERSQHHEKRISWVEKKATGAGIISGTLAAILSALGIGGWKG